MTFREIWEVVLVVFAFLSRVEFKVGDGKWAHVMHINDSFTGNFKNRQEMIS